MAHSISLLPDGPRRLLAAMVLPLGLAFGGAGLGAGIGGLTGPAAPDASRIEGYASVVDGATIDLGGQRIRIAGLTAPAFGAGCAAKASVADCGLAAALDLRRLVGWQKISCIARGRDAGERLIAACRFGDRDVSHQMRILGWGA
ncbi:hypothetical protein L2U69_06520 [Zavarzinia compransoris]|uniref:thermonuclease family protein n=1 Tax=Zavarzinia marina TaxID=2911065 RepID=UPI001F3BE5E0|nr:hypothetical protein [Zavarzinia marina]MCF4165291.1 hypothetical protein [Zavarzinia marina]